MEAFSYSVSHDLRAPLRIINGFGKLLIRKYADKFDADGRENLEIIMTNATHMGNLIDDLLDFSRMGRTELKKNTLDMNDMVKTVVDEVKSSDHNVAEVRMNDLKPANADPALLKQVWLNLVSNAAKYSRKKEKPVIEIGTFGENGSLTYYVKDNGAGFDMEHYGKLFGVFQRLHKVTEYEGTGVGLALTQRIINRHGGKIWAESKVDEGATFYFTLPTKQGAGTPIDNLQ
jgi:two-component system sensor histidine kinase/response regulator